MNEVFKAAAELQAFCDEQKWQFCFIGGLAVQRWANPRQTEDADLTLLAGFGLEENYIDALLRVFTPRAAGEKENALRRRALFLQSSDGVPIDVALGALPFEHRAVDRATAWPVADGISLLTCSAEDLIVHKAFAARDIDWADVTSIVIRRGNRLNVAQIWDELRPLVAVKEEPEISKRLQKIFDQHLGE